MSVSAHLTPEPERRLWLMLESMRQAVEETNWKVAAITAFAAMELALLKPAEAGPAWLAASAALTAALPLAFSPLSRRGKWPPHIEPKKKSSVDEKLI